jgi:hypothetical protein
MEIYLIDTGKVYQIRDEVIHQQKVPYRSNYKASNPKARNRAGLQLTFARSWQIGTETHKHLFRQITVFGTRQYMQSLADLAMNHRLKTNIYGIEIYADVYEFSIKTEESVWNESIKQYAALSWETKETGEELKKIEPVMVVARDNKFLDCPHCNNTLSHDEPAAMDRMAAGRYKTQKHQAEMGKIYAEETREMFVEGEFKGMDTTRFHKKYYDKGFWGRFKNPKFSKLQWAGLLTLGFFLAFAFVPQFRDFLGQMVDRVSGRGGP